MTTNLLGRRIRVLPDRDNENREGSVVAASEYVFERTETRVHFLMLWFRDLENGQVYLTEAADVELVEEEE